MKLVVVESPAKAKTINKYLGPDYEVVASFGHIRDLPPKDGSVDPEQDFAMLWEVDGKAKARVAEIARQAKAAERVILATDPDREGEAISWHLVEALNERRALKGKPVERVTFNAITKEAVQAAMARPREIDADLVDAYLARRALDYLVGFTLSPVLWRKLPGARSAGRVQSVALRLVTEREREIEAFRPREYWTLAATLATAKGETFEARLSGADGAKIDRLGVGTGEEAAAFKAALEGGRYRVAGIEAKPGRRNPPPPFTTSTLQQEASRKLGFSPQRTMQIAQKLYEGIDLGGETTGLITYMRTDGVDIAPEGIAGLRDAIGKLYGPKYLPSAPRKYSVKAKNAQEAHEAVRPTDPTRRPAEMAKRLDGDGARLYELIWNRTVASQMESAEVERTVLDVEADVSGAAVTLPMRGGDAETFAARLEPLRTLTLRATGQVITFDGFLKLYQEGRDDAPASGGEEAEDGSRLPLVRSGDGLTKEAIASTQHFTEPPARFSEASLVKRMEELGIGRPSTYASVLATLKDRDYVVLDKRRLTPSDKGRLVTAFLENFFARYVGYDFTAKLEEELDRVSDGKVAWRDVLRAFWGDFSGAISGAKELRITEVLDALGEALGEFAFPPRADGTDPRECTVCGTGRLSLKLGKFGAFVGCSNYPECKFTRPLVAAEGAEAGPGEAGGGPRVLGRDPDTDAEITLRDGRFGPYLQLGEGEKPKRASLPKGLGPAEVTLEAAIKLLALPREVARHPESGEPILAGIGRYGPYVQHGRTYANLAGEDDVLTVGANRAIDLIVTKEQNGGRGARGAPAGRLLGEHPTLGGPITLRDGRYGAYVNHGKVNATLPKEIDPATLALDEAAILLAARAEATGVKPARKKAAPKAAKPAAKSAAKTGKAPARAAKPAAAAAKAPKKAAVKKAG